MWTLVASTVKSLSMNQCIVLGACTLRVWMASLNLTSPNDLSITLSLRRAMNETTSETNNPHKNNKLKARIPTSRRLLISWLWIESHSAEIFCGTVREAVQDGLTYSCGYIYALSITKTTPTLIPVLKLPYKWQRKATP